MALRGDCCRNAKPEKIVDDRRRRSGFVAPMGAVPPDPRRCGRIAMIVPNASSGVFAFIRHVIAASDPAHRCVPKEMAGS